MSDRPRPKVSLKNLSAKAVVGPETFFHVDYDWWKESGRSIEAFLASRLGDDVVLDGNQGEIDLIDSNTAEVQSLNSLEYALQTYFGQVSKEEYAQRGSLVDSVFCVLLANGNQPLSAAELAEETGRSVDVVCKTLGGSTVYQGIRAYTEA